MVVVSITTNRYVHWNRFAGPESKDKTIFKVQSSSLFPCGQNLIWLQKFVLGRLGFNFFSPITQMVGSTVPRKSPQSQFFQFPPYFFSTNWADSSAPIMLFRFAYWSVDQKFGLFKLASFRCIARFLFLFRATSLLSNGFKAQCNTDDQWIDWRSTHWYIYICIKQNCASWSPYPPPEPIR